MRIATLVILLCFSLTANSAEIMNHADPDKLLEIIKGYGRATLGQDDANDPKIDGKMEGLNYLVIFDRCRNNEECQMISFRCAWSKDYSKNITLSDINEWNYKEMNFARLYRDDESDLILEMSINIRDGRTIENIDDTIDWWRASLVKTKKLLQAKAGENKTEKDDKSSGRKL